VTGYHNIYALLHCLFLNKPTECIWLCFIFTCSSSTVFSLSSYLTENTHVLCIMYWILSSFFGFHAYLKGNQSVTHSLTSTAVHTQW